MRFRLHGALSLSLVAAAAVFAGSVTHSHAADLTEKLCVLSAAEKVPGIVGIQITGSKIDKLSKEEAAKSAIGKYNNLEAIVNLIDSKITFVDSSLSENLKYQYSGGGPDAVREKAVAKLSAAIDGGVNVELQVKAAGQDVALSYVCIWDALGRIVTSSKGAIR